MFHVLVLGGIALVGGGACGGGASVPAEAGTREAGFPSELAVRADASVVDASFDTGLPSFGSDASTGGRADASDAAFETSFPMEVQ
jgi:hypothetical protein